MNSDKQVPNHTAYQQPVYEDEISLVDIVNVLLRRKKLILGITAVTVCIGLLYAFSQQRVYQVETILLPPSFEDIQPLNVLSSSNVNSSNVFASFISNVNSRKLRQAFFNNFKIIETLSDKSSQILTDKDNNDLFEGFSNSIKVKGSQITLESVHKEKMGEWLDSFVEMANQTTISQLVKNLQATIDSRIKSLKIQISSKRSIYKQRREDELGRLEEAYQIAKELGIRDHLFVPNVDGTFNRAVSAELDSISKSLSNENNLSIYMKGTKVLQAEINALKNRKSDDIHITGLRDLQEQLTRLEAIKIEKDKLQTVIVDKKAIVNVEPIRPKRKLIVILSLILGGMLGIFAVFIMEFISNFKKQIDSVDVA